MIKSITNHRRTRRDRESRDYICLCGKAYLSYAAVYTHIKKFHDFQKSYLDAVQRPILRTNRPGRPKNKKSMPCQQQNTLLTILETCILNIYHAVQGKIMEIILIGNEENDEGTYSEGWKPFEKMIRNRYMESEYEIESVLKGNTDVKELVDGLTKHFTKEIAVKVQFLIVVAYIEQKFHRTTTHEFVKMMNEVQLWESPIEINELIYEALQEWLKEKHSEELEHAISHT